jgi:uncharacterized protein YcnI
MRVLGFPLVAAVLFLGSFAGSPSAWAHVHANSDNAVRGATAIVTFEVPNESNSGAATTALRVSLPDVAAARTEAMAGWTAKLDRDVAAGTTRAVTWTAAPGGGIGPEQFGLFRISVQLPDTETVSFPTAQTYSDGSVVTWDQPPLRDGGEPEHPAPMLTLAAGPGAHDHQPAADGRGHHAPEHSTTPTSDGTARLLAGAALILGGLGVGLTLIRRRT